MVAVKKLFLPAVCLILCSITCICNHCDMESGVHLRGGGNHGIWRFSYNMETG